MRSARLVYNLQTLLAVRLCMTNMTTRLGFAVRKSHGARTKAAGLMAFLLMLLWAPAAASQSSSGSAEEFGPVVRAYLGYLRNEQEVVDDRANRREVTRAYYRRNSSRIRALRQMALRIVRSSGNDYIPELEAVTVDEMRNIFERPPAVRTLQVNHVLNNTFRFLGVERAGDAFYIFERLTPYEQADLIEKAKGDVGSPAPDSAPRANNPATRPRRAISRR